MKNKSSPYLGKPTTRRLGRVTARSMQLRKFIVEVDEYGKPYDITYYFNVPEPFSRAEFIAGSGSDKVLEKIEAAVAESLGDPTWRSVKGREDSREPIDPGKAARHHGVTSGFIQLYGSKKVRVQ